MRWVGPWHGTVVGDGHLVTTMTLVVAVVLLLEFGRSLSFKGHRVGPLGMYVTDGVCCDPPSQARDSNQAILDAKFSPDGQTLALASADNTIYLYAPAEEYEVGRGRKRMPGGLPPPGGTLDL